MAHGSMPADGSTPKPARQGTGISRDTLRAVVGGAALELLIVFFAQNMQSVQVHLWWWTWDTRMVWALVVAAVLGGIAIGTFLALRGRRPSAAAETQPGRLPPGG